MALYIVGTGISLSYHITEEARQAIKASNIIYALIPDGMEIDALKKINPSAKIIDCINFYSDKKSRPEVYDLISKKVLESYSIYSNIAFVTYGNPLFLVSAVERIITKAESLNIPTKVIPGISSMDTILADLKMDIGYAMSIFDATFIMKNRIKLNTSVPTLIFQLANINSVAIERGNIDNSRLEPLIDYLKQFYPSDHLCKIIVSQKSIFESGYLIDVSLRKILNNDSFQLRDRPTLFIPEK